MTLILNHALQAEGLAMFILASGAAIAKYHKMGDLNGRHLLLTLLEAGSLRSGCPSWSVLVTAVFLVCR
jgi:hypothetical protein